ncbi:MAG: hypothetical protein WA666_08975 [Nitrospirota bacterium]
MLWRLAARRQKSPLLLLLRPRLLLRLLRQWAARPPRLLLRLPHLLRLLLPRVNSSEEEKAAHLTS